MPEKFGLAPAVGEDTQDATAPDINPSGPWGKKADDRRAWDAMMAKQNQARANRQQ